LELYVRLQKTVGKEQASAHGKTSGTAPLVLGLLCRWQDRVRSDYPWALPILAFALTVRLADFAVGVVGATVMASPTFTGMLQSWERKDANWYIDIASHGYAYPGTPSSVNFFPLFPLAMWLVQHLTALLSRQYSYLLAGMAVSWLAFLAACLILYRFVSERFGSSVAYMSVVLLCVYPFGFYFGAAYSESLYLLLAVLAFWAAERRNWWVAGVCAGLASAARPPGMLVGFCVALLYVLDWLRTRHELRWNIIALGLAPLGLIAYMLYCWARFGDPTAYFKASAAGWGGHPHLKGIQEALWLLINPHDWFAGRNEDLLFVLYFLMLIVVLASCVPMWRLLGPPYVLYALGSSLAPIIELDSLNGMGRYYSVIFPTFIVIAYLLRNRPVARDGVLVTLALFLAFATIGFTGGYGFS
jgi:hypothetical protein